jgi:hypothetical protein
MLVKVASPAENPAIPTCFHAKPDGEEFSHGD